jgi:hypothetical protein
MIRACWWFVNIVLQGLEPDERDAVRGDLAECGETAGQAVCQVLGLFVRRQAALWINWRPWVGLLFLAVPLGIVFSVVSKLLAYGSAIYLWLYTNYWTPTILGNAASRHDFLRYVGSTLLNYGMIAGAAWICGFALGFVCCRSLPLNAVLFGVIQYVPWIPVWMLYTLRPRRSVPDPNAVAFEHAF